MKSFYSLKIMRLLIIALALFPWWAFALTLMELPLEDYNPTFKQPYKFVPSVNGADEAVSQVQLGDFEMKTVNIREVAAGIGNGTINPALQQEAETLLKDAQEWIGWSKEYGGANLEAQRAAYYATDVSEVLKESLGGSLGRREMMVYANYYEGRLEAMALAENDSKSGLFEIDRLFANPRGLVANTDNIKGAGTNLLQRIALDAKGRGYSSVKLEALSKKASYYIKQGFRHVSPSGQDFSRPSTSRPSTSGACN